MQMLVIVEKSFCNAACPCLCMPSGALQTRVRRASDARQKLLDPKELAVETERAGF